MVTHLHSEHRHGATGAAPVSEPGRPVRPGSVLRMSALGRLAIVSVPILVLWLLVALATDVWS